MKHDTEILEIRVQNTEEYPGFDFVVEENLKIAAFHCKVYKDGKLYGPIRRYRTREQTMAWLRLMLGDYPELYVKAC